MTKAGDIRQQLGKHMDTLLGQILKGRYQILSALGGGAFGQTYIAEDLQLPGYPQCVVKQFKPQTTDVDALETARRLFDTEAKVLHRLGKHDQIPQLLAHFEEDGEFFLVQDCIQGQPLNQKINKSNILKESEVVVILYDILTILSFVHEQNVIHRDIKPSNIIKRTSDGKLVLIDFGAVKQVTNQGTNEGHTVSVGTPGYMPGEQLAGQPRPNSDIYALGMMTVQALTGISPPKILQDPNTGNPIWRDKVRISELLAEVIDKMVRYHFLERYQTAQEVIADLERLEIYNPAGNQYLFNQNSDILPTLPPNNLTISQNGTTTPAQEITLAQEKLIDTTKKSFFQNPKLGYFWLPLLLTSFVVSGFFLFSKRDPLSAANQFLDQQKPDDALTVVDKVLAANEQDARAWKVRGDALFLLERYESALAAYQKASQLEPKNAKYWHNQGETYYILQQYEKALNAHQEALKISPNNIAALNGLGLAYVGIQRYEEALKTFNMARQIKPNDPLAWENQGLALEYLNRHQEAQRAYQEALASYKDQLKLQPQNLQARVNIGRILNKLQRPEEALKVFQEVIAKEANFFPAWINEGTTLTILRRPEEALKAFEKALLIRPNSYITWHNLGSLLVNLGRFEEAIKAYDRALEIQERFYPALRDKGFSQLQLQRSAEAFATFDKAIKIEPKDSKSWVGRSLALAKLKRFDEALAGLDRAVEIKPNDPAAWYNRGFVLEENQRPEEALKSYQEAIEIDPTFQPAIEARKKLQKPTNQP